MNTAAGNRSWTRLVRVGPLTMLLGAVLIAAGLVQTTASHFTGASCPGGTVLIAKFDYTFGGYHFESPFGNEHVVTISNANASGGSWHSTLAVSAVIVREISHSRS